MIPRCVGGSVMPCMEKLFPHLDNDNNDDYDGDDEDGVCNFDDSEEDGHDRNNHCLKEPYLHLDNDNDNDDDGDVVGAGDNDDDYNGKSGEDYHFSVPGLSISKNCPVVALEYALWNGVVIDISYRVSQKNVLVHRMLLEPWCAAIIAIGWHHLGLESVFWSFLTKTKQD